MLQREQRRLMFPRERRTCTPPRERRTCTPPRERRTCTPPRERRTLTPPLFLRYKQITNINLQNFDGNKRTTKEKTKNRKHHVFLIGDSIIQGQKTEFKRGLDEHKIFCRPKIRLPEAVHLVEDLRCKKEDIVIVLCGARDYPTWKRKEKRIRHEQAKKRTALPTNRYHVTSPLQQTSLAMQETLAKPQNYWQSDHDHWDTLNKTALSQHDNRLGQLKILVGNVQSLLPKMLELEAIASTLSHDIIAINETWLDLNGRHLPAEVSIKGYVLYNVDKPSHSNRGGGSLIYVKEKLQPQIKTACA
ncbi:Endonuclease/exonuclease/phosphatase [Trinorchestia longiramus]|nr:Endonuclease/exonuclease/phosphatase [Trinorchestia longiramus]